MAECLRLLAQMAWTEEGKKKKPSSGIVRDTYEISEQCDSDIASNNTKVPEWSRGSRIEPDRWGKDK